MIFKSVNSLTGEERNITSWVSIKCCCIQKKLHNVQNNRPSFLEDANRQAVTVKADYYRNMVRTFLIPNFDQHQNAYFQQDFATAHVAAITYKFYKNCFQIISFLILGIFLGLPGLLTCQLKIFFL